MSRGRVGSSHPIAGLAASIALAAGCTGCSTAGQPPRDTAWQVGFVSALGPATEGLHAEVDVDCSGALGRSAAARDVVALVTYVSRRGAPKRRLMPVDRDAELRQGDWVYFDADRCATPMVRKGR